MNPLNPVVISVPKKMDTTGINPIHLIDRKTIIQTLQTGKVEVVGQPLAGSNSTLLVSCKNNEISLFAIYKPERGEMPLWDFPRNSLTKRETAAYLASLLLGWHQVPPTILRSHATPYGRGSFQLFIHHDPKINFFNLPSPDPDALMKAALFDIIINNADRKGGHFLVDENKKIWLIDHGVCFHEEYKLRTVNWLFAGQPIPAPLLQALEAFSLQLKQPTLKITSKFILLLSSSELFMLIKRTDQLIQSAVFPAPDQDRRTYPWPLI